MSAVGGGTGAAGGGTGAAGTTPVELVEEIAANRRAERWVTFAAVGGAVVTVLVLLVVAALR